MKSENMKSLEKAMFWYFLIGTIFVFLMQYPNVLSYFLLPVFFPLTMFYMCTSSFVAIVYLIYGCLLAEHRHYVMNIIDGVFCYCLTVFFPFPLCEFIFDYNKYLYYFLGAIFSFLPLLFCIIDNKKIDWYKIFKVVVRIFMILFVALVILFANSCGVIDG